MLLVMYVCLLVCLQNNSNKFGWIWKKFSRNVESAIRNRKLKFLGYSGHRLYLGFLTDVFKSILYCKTIFQGFDPGAGLPTLSVVICVYF